MRNEVKVGADRRQYFPIRVLNIGGVERGVFVPAPAIQIRVPHLGHITRPALDARLAHKDADGHALLDVKDVFVLAACWRFLLFLAVAVQIEQINLVKALHQALPHAAKSGVVQIAVVGDEGQHPVAGALDAPLGKADELDVVVVQPFGVALAQRLAVHSEVIAGERAVVAGVGAAQQVLHPLTLVGRMPRIRRIAQHHHHRRLAFDFGRGQRFVGQPLGEQRQVVEIVRFFQRIGQVHAQALV